jgi:hypothetical protein
MTEWFAASTLGGWLILALAAVLPVFGLVCIVIGGRMVYERMRPRRATRQLLASHVSLPLNEVEQAVRAEFRAQGYEVFKPSDVHARLNHLVAAQGDERVVICCLPGEAMPTARDVDTLSEIQEVRQARRALLVAPVVLNSEVRRRAVQLGIELRDRTQFGHMQAAAGRQLQES